jgi:hypothetical protein
MLGLPRVHGPEIDSGRVDLYRCIEMLRIEQAPIRIANDQAVDHAQAHG